MSKQSKLIFVAYSYGKIDMLASFNRRRKMKAESNQIPQKLAARLKFLCCNQSKWCSLTQTASQQARKFNEIRRNCRRICKEGRKI